MNNDNPVQKKTMQLSIVHTCDLLPPSACGQSQIPISLVTNLHFEKLVN